MQFGVQRLAGGLDNFTTRGELKQKQEVVTDSFRIQYIKLRSDEWIFD